MLEEKQPPVSGGKKVQSKQMSGGLSVPNQSYQDGDIPLDEGVIGSDFTRGSQQPGLNTKPVDLYSDLDATNQPKQIQTNEEILGVEQKQEEVKERLTNELEEALMMDTSGQDRTGDEIISSFTQKKIKKPLSPEQFPLEETLTQKEQPAFQKILATQTLPQQSEQVLKKEIPALETVEVIPENRDLSDLEKKFITPNGKQESFKEKSETHKLKDKIVGEHVSVDLRPLRTYKDDLARAIEQKKVSIVSVAAAESKNRTKEKEKIKSSDVDIPKEEGQYLKKVGIIILSTLLFVLGTGSAFYFYGRSTAPLVEPEEITSLIIFVDESEELNISRLSRKQILDELVTIRDNSTLSNGKIKNIAITESFFDKEGVVLSRPVGASEFFNALNTTATLAFLRSVTPDFIIGVHAFGGNNPFLILRTSFYENAFAGMLEWEDTLMEDFSPLFGLVADEEDTIDTRRPRFTDVIIKNKDVRVLKNNSGKIVLLYSFTDRGTIVITTNENTFIEVFTRLTSSKTVR